MPYYLFDNFYYKIYNLQVKDLHPEFELAKTDLIQKMNELAEIRNQDLMEQYKKALELTDSREFDLNLIRIARVLTHDLIREKSNTDEFSYALSDNLDFILNDTLSMEKEGGDLSLMFLPMSLGIQIIQFMYLDTPRMVIQKFPEEVNDQKHVIINIIRREAHYDILCSIQQMETELIDFETGMIFLPKNYHADKESLIYYLRNLG